MVQADETRPLAEADRRACALIVTLTGGNSSPDR
jgi:hypothetical protein